MTYRQYPDMVPESEYKNRMSICDSCENKQLKKSPVMTVCILCNCPVENTNKLKTSSCPINKWGEYK